MSDKANESGRKAFESKMRFDLCIRDNRAAEDSTVFQIFNRVIDLLERVSPRHQLI